MAEYVRGAATVLRAARWRPILHERGNRTRYAALRASDVWSGAGLPRGRGPVLLIPGWMAGEGSMGPLARFLERLGYSPRVAPVGRNIGCYAETADELLPLLSAWAASDGPVALVAHSRGGVLAAELARRSPETISSVVTLSAPLLAPFASHPLVALHILAMATLGAFGRAGHVRPSCPAGACCADVRAAAGAPLRLRLVSIYTGDDGIIDPATCLHPSAQHVELSRSSHGGLLVDARAYRVIAQTLAGAGSV